MSAFKIKCATGKHSAWFSSVTFSLKSLLEMCIRAPCAAVHVIEGELNLHPSVFPALLSSLTQEELRHFETKVEKHSHYQEQLELSHQKLLHVEALGDKEHIKKTQEKYDSLAEKTREIGYKVRRRNSGGQETNTTQLLTSDC